MENASKGLLIAAAVLVVILLIAFGMRIFNSTGDTSEDAKAVGESIGSSSTSAKINAILSMIDYRDDATFQAFLEKNYGNGKALSKNEVIELYEVVMARTQILYNSPYNWYTIHPPSTPGAGVIYYDINTKSINYDALTNKKYYLHMSSRPNSVAAVIKDTPPQS